MGCYLFSIMINGFLPLQWPNQGVFTSSVLWLLGFTPSVGLNMGLTPSMVWIWALPHQWFEYGPNPISGSNMGFTPSVGLNMGFTPSVVYLFGLYPICGLFGGLYPHPWFVWRALSPSVVCLKGFIPIRGLFEGLYPHQWYGWRALPRQCFDSSLGMLPQ